MSLKFTVAILTDKRDEVIALLMPFNGGGNWNFMTQSLFVQWCCSAIVDLGTSFNEMLILMLTLNHWSELQSRGSAYYPLAAVLCTLSSAPSCKVLVPFPTFDPCSSLYQDTIIRLTSILSSRPRIGSSLRSSELSSLDSDWLVALES